MSKYKFIISFCVKITVTVAKDIKGVNGIDDFIEHLFVIIIYNPYILENTIDKYIINKTYSFPITKQQSP